MPTIKPIKPAASHKSSPNSGGGLSGAFQCGIVLIDAWDRVIPLSEVATQMLKLSGRKRIPKTLEALHPTLQREIAEARSTRRPIIDRYLELPDRANGSLTLRLNLLPANSESGRPTVALIMQDMTAGLRFERNLRRLDRLASIGTLSAGMAHEIKNALVVGKTFFDLLLEKHQDTELVGLVQRELTRIESLVSPMLRFAGPAKPAFAEVRVHAVLDQSLRLIERQLKDKSIQLDRSYAAASDHAQGDEYQLEQAFVNLLLNAIEAMGPNGRLKVATQMSGASRATGRARRSAELNITIQDNGIGIRRANMRCLFQPFFTTKKGGTGLGLSITRRIIEEHGGVISVKSKPHQGTAFQILLPAI